MIDRGGELIVTLADGTVFPLGVVVGKDGVRGLDGNDGFGLDDFQTTFDGERTLTLRFVRGDLTKEFAYKLPYLLDRGVWKDSRSYERGDGVSFGGSIFIAQRDTKAGEKPETSDAWRLGPKRGQNGKDGPAGKQGPAGRDGKDGRDLTQMGFDGQKH